MTHPASRTRRRARDQRANPRRYTLTPAGRAWLERDEPMRGLVLTQEIERQNRQAFAHLRAVNSALIVAGLLRRPKHKKP